MTAVHAYPRSLVLPLRGWRQFGDNRLLLALAVSAAAHLTLLAVASRFPAGEEFPRFWPVVEAPFISFPPLPAPPTAAPVPAPPAPPTAAGPSSPAPRPGPNSPEPANPGRGANLLTLIENNPDVLNMLTHEGNGSDHAAAMTPSASFALPAGGVQVADNGHAPNFQNDSHGRGIDLPGDLLHGPHAALPIAGRTRREVVSAMTAPKTDAADAEAGRLVRQALLSRLPAVKHCYERAINANPQLAGKITVQAAFDAAGVVQSATLLFDGLGDPPAAACILEAVRRARTTAPLGAPVTATTPYIFAVAN